MPARSRTASRAAKLVSRAKAAQARNAALARKLIADIRRRTKRIDKEFHAIGKALEELSKKAMYSSLGHASFDALLKRERLITKTQAYKLMAIAGAYKPAEAKALGIAKAYSLLSYVAATPADDAADELAKADARIGERHISQLSVRELTRVVQHVRKETGGAKPHPSDRLAAERAARALQRDLRQRGARDAAAKAIRVKNGWRVSVHVASDDVRLLMK